MHTGHNIGLKPLPGRTNGPDGRKFTWGPIDAIHQVGPYTIVEYRRDNSNTTSADPDGLAASHDQTHFHPYIDGKDTAQSFLSLDQALIGAIAYRHEGPNTRAPGYIYSMLDMR